MRKIAIIGNGGGGKTTLARRIAERLELPLIHVDSIQFLENWGKRSQEETRSILNAEAEKDKWVIDGFGPLDVIETRFKKADRVIFVDFPLWRHFWWATKRCLKAYKKNREELPPGCSERGLSNMLRLYKMMWHVHVNIRPVLISIIEKPEVKNRVVMVKNLETWRSLYDA